MKYFSWFPRVLSLAMIGFISLFALDVIGQPRWLLGLVIHLIPTYVLILLTAVAWRKPGLGGVLFLVAGVIALGLTSPEALILILPTMFIGILYLVDHFVQTKNRA